MASLRLALLILSLLLFILAGLSVPSGRANLIAFGLAAWVATLVIP